VVGAHVGRGSLLRVLLALALTLPPHSAESQGAPAKEYQLKAVFLYHFSQFVEWPEDAFAGADDPLVIGVLGKDPFGPYLDDAIKGEKVGNHPLVVRHFDHAEDVKACHILFIPADEGRQARAMSRFSEQHVLTVGDAEDFARRGGMVALVNDHNRIRLLVNLGVAEGAGLKLSSKLLRPAEIVGSRKN